MYHNISLYMAAPTTTIDPKCQVGSQIPIEERDPDEVRGCANSRYRLVWTLPNAKVKNPAFDVTPRGLVTGVVTDQGVFYRGMIEHGVLGRLA